MKTRITFLLLTFLFGVFSINATTDIHENDFFTEEACLLDELKNSDDILAFNDVIVNTVAELTNAMTNAVSGDVIIVEDGTYDLGSAFVMSSKVGTAVSPIIIKAENVYGARITGGGRLQLEDCDYIKFEGIAFDTVDEYTALRLVDCNNVTISQCSFIDTRDNTNVGFGIRLDVASGDATRNASNIIENCFFKNIETGIYIGMANNVNPTGNNIIRNNVFRDPNTGTTGNAISLLNSGTSDSKTIVDGNVFDSWNVNSVIFSVTNKNIIKNNIFYNSREILNKRGDDNIIEKNQFLNGVKFGIELRDDRNLVFNNIFRDLTDDAVRLARSNSQTRDALIAHNVVAGSTNGFIRYIETGTSERRNRVLNNIVSINSGDFLLNVPVDDANTTLDYNVFHNQGGATGAISTDNNIASDPLLNNDEFLTIQINSPIKGAGIELSEVKDDIYGNPRNNDDIGHITYPNNISGFITPFMFYPENTTGYEALPIEAIYDTFEANRQTGDVIMLDARGSKGTFSFYRWTIIAQPSGETIFSGPIDESVYSFVFDDTQTYSVTLELLDGSGNVLASSAPSLSILDEIQKSDSNTVTIYPNPTNNLLNINSKEELNLSMYSITGKLVKKEKLSIKHIIDISNMAKGLYILRFENNNREYYLKKLIVD